MNLVASHPHGFLPIIHADNFVENCIDIWCFNDITYCFLEVGFTLNDLCGCTKSVIYELALFDVSCVRIYKFYHFDFNAVRKTRTGCFNSEGQLC